jgi:dGTPase
MQVFTGEMGDYHRTRLTHTHEVATIARTVGRVLRLNEDLIEALALLHDIGHPPFGHSGEEALNESLQDLGGFSHNQFALTIVEELETRYSNYPGLNLSREILDGQSFRITHQGAVPILEVQVVDLADSIAYNAHDADDALKLGLLEYDQLRSLDLVQIALNWDASEMSSPPVGTPWRKLLVHHLIEVQVADLLENALERLGRLGQMGAREVQAASIELSWSPQMAAQRSAFSGFLFENVYRHPQLVTVRQKASRKIRELFQLLSQHPERMPERFRSRAEAVGAGRAAADYIGGMTDRFCDNQYHRLVYLGRIDAEDWH